jgi:hypothetical protein
VARTPAPPNSTTSLISFSEKRLITQRIWKKTKRSSGGDLIKPNKRQRTRGIWRLQAATEELGAFEKSNKIPDSLPAKHPFRKAYPRLRDQMVRAFEAAKREYTQKSKFNEAEAVGKELKSFRDTTWDPRSSQDVNYDKLIVKSDNHTTPAHDMDGHLKNDISANAKIIIVGDKAYVSGFADAELVLCTHPFPGAPATIDFGDLTIGRTGTLTLLAQPYPRTDGGRVVVKVDGRNIADGDHRVNDPDGWEEIIVPFSRKAVAFEHHAVGWNMEDMFFTYRIIYQGP